MNKIEKRLRKIVNHDGISFAYYNHKDATAPITVSSTEEATHRQNLTLALRSEKLGEVAEGVGITDGIRVLVGDEALAVFRQDGHCVVIVFLKGHAIVKSVQRMGRRLLKKAVEAPRSPPADSPVAANDPRPDFL